MTSYELLILKLLYTNGASNEVFCITKENIKNKLDEKKEVAYRTFLRKLKNLTDGKYVLEGGKDGKKKRYYISDLGIQAINKN